LIASADRGVGAEKRKKGKQNEGYDRKTVLIADGAYNIQIEV